MMHDFFLITKNFGYIDTGGDWQKCHCCRLSQYEKVLFGTKNCQCNRCHCNQRSLHVNGYSLLLEMNSIHVHNYTYTPPPAALAPCSAPSSSSARGRTSSPWRSSSTGRCGRTRAGAIGRTQGSSRGHPSDPEVGAAAPVARKWHFREIQNLKGSRLL